MTKTINGSTYRVDTSTGQIYILKGEYYYYFGMLRGRTLEKAVMEIEMLNETLEKYEFD